jgi:hypothetical protein
MTWTLMLHTDIAPPSMGHSPVRPFGLPKVCAAEPRNVDWAEQQLPSVRHGSFHDTVLPSRSTWRAALPFHICLRMLYTPHLIMLACTCLASALVICSSLPLIYACVWRPVCLHSMFIIRLSIALSLSVMVGVLMYGLSELISAKLRARHSREALTCACHIRFD